MKLPLCIKILNALIQILPKITILVGKRKETFKELAQIFSFLLECCFFHAHWALSEKRCCHGLCFYPKAKVMTLRQTIQKV